MATAKQAQNRRTDAMPARGRKAQPSEEMSLRELYARLEENQPGSEEAKRISAQIVDSIG